MGNNNSQTKAKGMISRGVGDKELEIRLSTTVFWAVYSNRHAILARNNESIIVHLLRQCYLTRGLAVPVGNEACRVSDRNG